MRRSPLRRVSKKQAARNQIYSKLRKEFLTDQPVCSICREQLATDIHHKEGRGSKTNDVSTWMALCRSCHEAIHRNGKLARENGYLT